MMNMGMEDFKKPDDSGYRGSGFKFSPEEFKAEIGKLVDIGKSYKEARDLVIRMEKIHREDQQIKRQQEDPPYDLGDIKDWVA